MKIDKTMCYMTHPGLKPIASALLGMMLTTGLAAVSNSVIADTASSSAILDLHHTTTPIKHVVLLIGENRTFDNIFATYVPHKGQKISNLLSKGIVTANGEAGPNANLAAQSMLNSIPASYFTSQPASNKSPYSTLPPPNTSYVPAVGATYAEITLAPTAASLPLDPSFTLKQLHHVSPALSFDDLYLLTTGGTGLDICSISSTMQYPAYPPQGCYETDTRIYNYNNLSNTVYPIYGANLPYDSFTGDQVHRFYHMWEQSDCNVSNATATNPSGCLNDLYPYVGVARADGSGSNSMGFYNVQHGDAPILKRLADEYTIMDNYHQPVMGGTFVQHQMLGTADGMPWQPYTNLAGQTIATPPSAVLVDPTPNSTTSIAFTADKAWTSCDATWAQQINAYEASLPWNPSKSPTTCTPGQYYQINNVSPGYQANGTINDAGVTSGSLTPPSSVRTIGDALNDKNISWAYYGGGYNAAVRVANGGDTNPIDIMIGTGGAYYCDICNPFGYTKSIMGDPAQRKAHIKDATDFFKDVENNTLPAVAYVKPDSFTDGHPASSKLDLFEALVERMYTALQKNPELFNETLFLITWDEGGGYWDSGFYQPVDFFGDGPRIPMIAISPYTAGGIVDHTYSDHGSVLKFIERNWGLSPLTSRSRDNLPNPVHTAENPYVPTNMPAIGDLFGLIKTDQFSHY